jgi:antitoxin MazE
MIKTLSKHGNSRALIIDQAVLDLLQVDGDTPFEITTDGRNLILHPLSAKERKRDAREERKRFETALAAINRKHGRLLQRLAR